MESTGFAGANDIAQAFVGARQQRRAMAAFPGPVPATLGEAYQVQDAALASDPRTVGGWKLGKINPPHADRLGANRLAGPIFTDQIVDADPAGTVAMPIFRDGFGAAEAEFLLRIGTAPDPSRTDYTIDSAMPLIDAVHAGIEVASSPYPGINADGPTVTVSDYGNNNGLVIGPAIEGWRDRSLEGWTVELLIDDAVIGSATAATMLDGPFGAAAFLFNLAARRGIALTPGQWISSGAVTGVHNVIVGNRVEARFGGGFATACTITD